MNTYTLINQHRRMGKQRNQNKSFTYKP